MPDRGALDCGKAVMTPKIRLPASYSFNFHG